MSFEEWEPVNWRGGKLHAEHILGAELTLVVSVAFNNNHKQVWDVGLGSL